MEQNHQQNRKGPESETQKKGNVTIFDVAERAGVSFVSVSRVFNGHANVSDRMRNRVLDAARSLGYQPRLVARPGRLGILVSDEESFQCQSNHYQLCNHLLREASRNGYFLDVIPAGMQHMLTQNLVDGVIEIDLGESVGILLQNDFPNIPVVMTSSCPLRDWNSLVTVDFEAEVETGLKPFLQNGHQRIAVLMEDKPSLAYDARRRVVREMKEGRHNDRLQLDIFSPAHGTPNELVDRILQNGYTGLLNFCNNLSLPLLDVLLNQQGCRIPEDLSLLMLDNDDLCSQYHPRISSLRQPTQAIAETAVQELLRLIRGEKPSSPRTFSSTYVDHHTIRQLSG